MTSTATSRSVWLVKSGIVWLMLTWLLLRFLLPSSLITKLCNQWQELWYGFGSLFIALWSLIMLMALKISTVTWPEARRLSLHPRSITLGLKLSIERSSEDGSKTVLTWHSSCLKIPLMLSISRHILTNTWNMFKNIGSEWNYSTENESQKLSLEKRRNIKRFSRSENQR